MAVQQAIQACEFADDVVRVVPGKAAAGVDVDALGREPFNAAGEAKAAADAGKGAKAIAKQRPGAATRSEAFVVMRFAVMNEEADAPDSLEAVIEISRDFGAGIVLKEFGVGPLHAAFRDQLLGDFPRAAEAFEQKNGFGEFL